MGQFRVKEAYSPLDRPLEVVFPKNKIWVERVPTKIVFFAWEEIGRASCRERV